MKWIHLNPDTIVTMIFEGATLTSVALWLQPSTFNLQASTAERKLASALVPGWDLATTI